MKERKGRRVMLESYPPAWAKRSAESGDPQTTEVKQGKLDSRKRSKTPCSFSKRSYCGAGKAVKAGEGEEKRREATVGPGISVQRGNGSLGMCHLSNSVGPTGEWTGGE